MDKQSVRDKYKDAIKPLSKAPKDWTSWIAIWEEAISLGEQKGIAETAHPINWFADFIQAIIPMAT